MAFTRAYLRGLGIDDDKVSAIMEAHVEVTEALKKQRDDYKADADKYQDAKKELDDLKNGDDWEKKYNDLKNDFDTYKSDREKADTKAKKSGAYREMLKEIGVKEDFLDAVIRIADIDSVELDKDGKIKDIESITESAKKNYAVYIPNTQTRGADVPTPKTNTGGAMTRDQIMAIKDRDARHEAIRNNPEAFNYNRKE